MRHVAIDIGTSGGKILAGGVDAGSLSYETVHRFDPGRAEADGLRIWDVDHLRSEIVAGLERVEARHGRIETVGIDATAGAFGFVADSEPVRNPVREGSPLPEHVSRRDAFFRNGHGRLPTSYYDTYQRWPEVVESADWLALLPALLAAELGGEPHGELTYAISAGLGNTRTGGWATETLELADLPTDVLPPMAEIGETVGRTTVESLDSDARIVAVPGHDTSSAVAAIPFRDHRAFLATGSWFIPGFEVPDPIVTEEAYEIDAENVGGVCGRARFVQNIPGFSLLESCRAEWREQGGTYEYEALVDAAADAEPYGPLIDPTGETARALRSAEEPVEGLAEYCRTTGQRVPEGEGEVTRCLLESLSAKSAVVLDRLADAADVTRPDELRTVGGGVRNDLLLGMIADATDTTVAAGPVEATGIGNLLIQLRAAGDIDSIAEGRAVVGETLDIQTVEPGDHEAWGPTLERMRSLESRS